MGRIGEGDKGLEIAAAVPKPERSSP
jgi:hypothetical protein